METNILNLVEAILALMAHPNVDLKDQSNPLVESVLLHAEDNLINASGTGLNYEAVALLRSYGVQVIPGERDSFGLLSAGVVIPGRHAEWQEDCAVWF